MEPRGIRHEARGDRRTYNGSLPPTSRPGKVPTMRNVLAVVFGVAIAGFAVMGVELLGHAIYPPPQGLSPDDPKAIEAYIAGAPFLAIAFVLFAWAVGAFVGGAVAARVAAGRWTRRYGVRVGLVLFVMAAMNMWMIPHPLWFMLAAPFACLIPGWLGGLVGAPREA